MSVDYLYYEREAAYEALVDEIAEELKVQHREEAIDEFVQSRLCSYYRENPDIAIPARNFLRSRNVALTLGRSWSLGGTPDSES